MKGIKTKLLKMLPNNKYVSFKNSHSFSIDERLYPYIMKYLENVK